MEATLIFNSKAGATSGVNPEDLLQWLEEAGFQPAYEATETEDDLKHLLERPRGLVIVAGGDGSVRAAASFLAHTNVPMAILPLGTANNIAQSLEIQGSPREIINGLAQPRSYCFDIGRLEFPGGSEFFLEAFGFGLFAEGLAHYEPDRGKSVVRSLNAAIQALREYQVRDCQVILDGVDISGRYVMVEVLNTCIFGPWLKAAPQADASDGLLDVICIHEENRASWLAYLLAVLNGQLPDMPGVDTFRGRNLNVEWDGFILHADAQVISRTAPQNGNSEAPAGGGKPALHLGQVHASLLPGALHLWLPQSETS